ncbi:MAG: hemoglobin [Solirubrobacteraceae bacterium]|nr:hemoglobin [Solirubrobacteraceae bacterium]
MRRGRRRPDCRCTARDAWLRAMRAAVDEADLAGAHRERLWSYLETTAHAMTNSRE